MNGEVVIRPMRQADLPHVLAIENQVFTTPWTEATFRGLLRRADADLFVACVGEELAGYAAAWSVLDQGELGDLAVSHAYRRRGVGGRLVERVLERLRARGVHEVFLEVRVSNRDARRLYERFGFEPVGRRRGYYSAPAEDALVLRRRLDAPRPPSNGSE